MCRIWTKFCRTRNTNIRYIVMILLGGGGSMNTKLTLNAASLPTRIPSVDVYYTCHLVWVQRLIHVALKRILNAVSARVRRCHLYWNWNHLYTSCKRKLNINYTWITFGSEYLICMLLKHILYVGDFIDTYMTWVHNNDALLTSHLEGLEPTILCLAVARSTDWATGAWPYNHHLHCAYY